MKDLLWQPFVPGAGANAQLVLDPERGGTADFILCAGWRSGSRIKTGQIFCQRKAHYLPSLQLHAGVHTIARELAYLPGRAWKTDILADAARRHVLEAVFFVRSDGNLQISVEAVNLSKKNALWRLDLFWGLNVPGKEAGLPDGFEITDSFGMFTAPPFKGGEHPDGLFADWGTLRDLKRYPDGLIPRFAEIAVPPQSRRHGWILIGRQVSSASPEKEPCFPEETGDGCAFRHLAAQLAVTRSYPMTIDGTVYPLEVFTPCAHMDWPFIWDAGFAAAGLAVTDPALSEKCIASYLPGYPGSAWSCALGAPVPTQIMAALELFQQTGDSGVMKRLYPGLRRLWRKAAGLETWNALHTFELDPDHDGLIAAPGGGSGLDDAPSQIWARGSGVDWARQENYWLKPIAVNPTGGVIDTESVNLTAFAVLGAKILRLFADEPEMEAYIAAAEHSLQTVCWNEETGHFHWVTGNGHDQTPYFDLSGLTPLFAGIWRDETQRDRLLTELFGKYMTRRGLTTVWPEAEFFRQGYWCGAVWIPFHWMFWKQLIGMGLFDKAEIMAGRIVGTWLRAYRKFPVNYEKFDLATGDGGGSLEFGGLAGVLLNLYAACRGNVKYRGLGWNTLPERWDVSPALDAAEIVLRSVTDTGMRIMLLPETRYAVSVNGAKKRFVSDRSGGLNIAFPPGRAVISVRRG